MLNLQEQERLFLAIRSLEIGQLGLVIKDLKSHYGDIDLNFISDDGRCLLHEAISCKNFEDVEFLLQNGASLMPRKDTANSTLLMALDGGSSSIIKLLLQHAKTLPEQQRQEFLAIRNSQNEDALAVAIRKVRSDVVKLLLECGADVNARYKNQDTALLLAIRLYSGCDLCKILCDDPKIDLALENEYGQTALALSISFGMEDLVELIDSYGKINLCQRYKQRRIPLLDIAYQNMDGVLKKYLQGDQIDFLKAKIAYQQILMLAYDQDTFYSFKDQVLRHLVAVVDGIDVSKKDKILQVLDFLRREQKLAISANEEIKFFDLRYISHIAFGILELEGGLAKRFLYCDGNLPLFKINRGGFGVVIYNIDPLKAQMWRDGNLDASNEILQFFKSKTVYEKSSVNIENLKDILRNFVICDAGNQPVAKFDMLMSAQERGNCSLKAVNMALRYGLQKLDSSLTYDSVTLGVTTEGYRAYKEYKYKVIEKCLTEMIRAAYSPYFQAKIEPIYSMVMDSLQGAFLHAASKNHVNVLEEIAKILRSQAIDLASLKTIETKETAIETAVKSKSVDALEWCLQNGMEIDLQNEDFFRYICRSDNMLQCFARHYLHIDYSHPIAIKIAQNFLDLQKNDLLENMLRNGLDVNHTEDGENIFLSKAVMLQNIDLIAKLVVNEKFDVEQKDSCGSTVLLQLLELRIHPQDAQKEELLKRAIGYVIKQRAANLAAQNDAGMTALALAAQNGDEQICKLLRSSIDSSPQAVDVKRLSRLQQGLQSEA